MSTDDTKALAEIINGILKPDNAIRNEAVKKLETLRQNTPVLIYHLFKIIQDFPSEKQTHFISAVLLRKLLEVSDKAEANSNWKLITKQHRDEIKKISMSMLLNESDKKLKSQFSNIVSQVFENVCLINDEEIDKESTEDIEDFPEVMEFITKFLASEINEANLLNIETALQLLASNYPDLIDDFQENKKDFLTCFKKFFMTNSLSLKTKTTRTIAEIISYCDKDEFKEYNEFILNVLETTLRCFENTNEESNLKMCVQSICEIIHSNPRILVKHFSDLYILMIKIIEKKDYLDEKIRDIGFEVIVKLIERVPNLFKKDQEKLAHFVETLYKYALEFDKEITEEWCNPKSDDYIDEEIIEDEKLSAAFSFLSRLVQTIPEESLLELQKIITKLLEVEGDFGYKYIALFSISELTNHVDDISTIESILPKVFLLTGHENVKVRNAALFCIRNFSEEYKKEFTKTYHKEFMTVFSARIKEEKVLRNQLEAMVALSSFVNEASVGILQPYVKDILTVLVPEITKIDLSIPVNLTREIINVVSSLAGMLENEFAPFASDTLAALNSAFMSFYSQKANQPLYKEFIEGIPMIGVYCQETFVKVLPEFVKVLLEIQNSISLTTDPTRGFLESAYENIIPILKEHYPNLLPEIIASVFKLVQNLPEMSISSVPNQEFKIDDLLSNLNENPEEVKLTNVKDINTSSTEEMESSLKLFKRMIISLGELFLPYLETAQKEILPLINYRTNSNIRMAAAKVLPHIIDVVAKHSTKEIAGGIAKVYLSELMASVQNDKELDNSAFYVKIKRIGKIVSKLDYFLAKDELNNLFENLAKLIDETEKRRLELLEEKQKLTELQSKKTSVKPNAQAHNLDEESDDEDFGMMEELEDDIEEIENIQSVLSDNIGYSFKTHKDISHDIVNYIIQNWLPKYFRSGASYFEISMGIFIIDDMMQYLGQQFLGAYWGDLVKILILYTTNSDHIVRRAANYGIGEIAEWTVQDFNLYAVEALNGLYQSLAIPEDKTNKEAWGGAKDNATRSLGKIMKFHSGVIDLNTCYNTWLSHLPIVYDELESAEQHELLCDFVLNKPEFAYGENLKNYAHIVKVFAKIYASKLFTSEAVDEKIRKIVQTWKDNATFASLLANIVETCDKKQQKKIKKMVQ